MTTAVIVDAVRTPVAKGKPGGAYSEIHPVDLHAHTLRALVERTGLDPVEIDDVISGAVGQVGAETAALTRLLSSSAGEQVGQVRQLLNENGRRGYTLQQASPDKAQIQGLGTVIESSKPRVAPPSTRSAQRAWP